MRKIYQNGPTTKLMRKLGEKETAYNNRKRVFKEKLGNEIYLGHTLCSTENTKNHQTISPPTDEIPKVSEIETSRTSSFYPLQNQINNFFKNHEAMETELKNLRSKNKILKEKNKDLEDALMAVRRAITVI